MAARWLGCFLALFTGALCAAAQGTASIQGPARSSVTDELRSMTDAADVIFAGTVISVQRMGGGAGAVEVRFAVEQAIEGCTAGGVYTLREWAGLWAGGVERYRTGQRLLMLLHAPGPGGLSSPVGGQDGAMPLVPVANDPGRLGGLSAGRAKEQVDLRWIGARVRRPVAYRVGAGSGAPTLRPGGLGMQGIHRVQAQAMPRGAEAGSGSVSVAVDSAGAGVATVQSAPAEALLSMMTEWRREKTGAR